MRPRACALLGVLLASCHEESTGPITTDAGPPELLIGVTDPVTGSDFMPLPEDRMIRFLDGGQAANWLLLALRARNMGNLISGDITVTLVQTGAQVREPFSRLPLVCRVETPDWCEQAPVFVDVGALGMPAAIDTLAITVAARFAGPHPQPAATATVSAVLKRI